MPNGTTISSISRVVGMDPLEVRDYLDGTQLVMPMAMGIGDRREVRPAGRGLNNVEFAGFDRVIDLVRVPLFSSVPASAKELGDSYAIGFAEVSTRLRATFAAVVRGECMVPAIDPGDTIIASRPAWDDDDRRMVAGKIYVVCFKAPVDGMGEVTLKRAERDSKGRPGWFRLEALNRTDPRFADTAWDEPYSNVEWAAKVVQINKG